MLSFFSLWQHKGDAEKRFKDELQGMCHACTEVRHDEEGGGKYRDGEELGKVHKKRILARLVLVFSETGATGGSLIPSCALWPPLSVGARRWRTGLFVAGFVFVTCGLCCQVCLLLLVATLCITTHTPSSDLRGVQD